MPQKESKDQILEKEDKLRLENVKSPVKTSDKVKPKESEKI